MIRTKSFRVLVEGPRACFTRPELRADRASYEVMTPAAARGLLDTMFIKFDDQGSPPGRPRERRGQFRWVVEQIEVLRPINFICECRNEVDTFATGAPIMADESRRQVRSMLLTDVAYVVQGYMRLNEGHVNSRNTNKYEQMFERTMRRGALRRGLPFLGTRDCVASDIRLLEDEERPSSIAESRYLGPMVHDYDFHETGPLERTPRYFHAQLQNGVMAIPSLADSISVNWGHVR